MTETRFWQQKVLQILHDPPMKPVAGHPTNQKLGGHFKQAINAANQLLDDGKFEKKNPKTNTLIQGFYEKAPDLDASGADRPMMHVGRQSGVTPVQVRGWPKHPLVSHPLCDCQVVYSPQVLQGHEFAKAIKKEFYDVSIAFMKNLAEEISESMIDQPHWTDPNRLKTDFLAIWRRQSADLRELVQSHEARQVWQLMPADTRSPDIPIQDHTRIVSALAPSAKAKGDINQLDPWFFRFEIGPVGRFIAHSRTSRDLWTRSYLFSDLIFAAMQPIIDHYGPDCIVYPDLRGNPRMDNWLQDYRPECLPTLKPDTASYASVLPNTFTALVPLGGEGPGYLKPLADVARLCQQSLESRWLSLQLVVRDWLQSERPDMNQWQIIFDRQCSQLPLASSWTAVRWSRRETHASADTFADLADTLNNSRPALVAQPSASLEKNAELELNNAVLPRERRLRPWVDNQTWARYEEARITYSKTNGTLMRDARGFDYALTHHQLRKRHALRKADNSEPTVTTEPGEKCSLCGERQSLAEGQKGTLAEARDFWYPESGILPTGIQNRLNPDDETDRLCGVCTVMRFLVEADGTADQFHFNRFWAGGSDTATRQLVLDGDNITRVPFPSTATIAAQSYLFRICSNDSYKPLLQAVVSAYRVAGLQRTGFARALRPLAEASRLSNVAREFLMLDTQSSVFPHTLELKIRKAETTEKKQALIELQKAVRNLRKETADEHIDTRFAILQIDGDRVGALLLGEKDQIGARWRDVLHPEAVAQMLDNPHFKNAGWHKLLDEKRLMGPGLHAYISRALANFSHCIVPWVVEREFEGRVIYAGGDDLLALVPADQSLRIAARLRQIYCSPWIIDTQPDENAWRYRHDDSTLPTNNRQPSSRFVIPRPQDSNSGAIQLPLDSNHIVAPICKPDTEVRFDQLEGDILPMLGPSCTLSAGISIGHFKTDLGLMLRNASELLHDAKEKSLRDSLAVGVRSRGGEVARIAFKWHYTVGGKEISACEAIECVQRGFKNNSIPRSLPYKLKRYRTAVELVNSQDDTLCWQFLSGVLHRELGVRLDDLLSCQHLAPVAESESDKIYISFQVLLLWLWGIRYNLPQPESGLLLARKMALGEEETGE